jgi:hypothetical protein
VEGLEMRGHRVVGASSIIALTVGLYLLGLVQTAAAQSQCQLSVEPTVAVAGTTFQVRGSGFTPTQLILQRDGGAAATIDLDLKGADPFEFPIGSKRGDEGTWHATAALPGTCSPSVVFTATLEPTDTVSDAVAALTLEQDGHLPLGIYLLVIVVGLVGGIAVALKLDLAR